MLASKLSSKGQIVIPKEVRDALGLKPGQVVVFVTVGNTVSLIPQKDIAELRGIAKGCDISNYRDRSDLETKDDLGR